MDQERKTACDIAIQVRSNVLVCVNKTCPIDIFMANADHKGNKLYIVALIFPPVHDRHLTKLAKLVQFE
jgi:hypothetical protein